MAIKCDPNSIVQVSPDTFEKASYFLIKGTVAGKKNYILSFGCYKESLDDECKRDVTIGSYALTINDPALLTTLHNEAVDYLKQLNPNIDFQIVEL